MRSNIIETQCILETARYSNKAYFVGEYFFNFLENEVDFSNIRCSQNKMVNKNNFSQIYSAPILFWGASNIWKVDFIYFVEHLYIYKKLSFFIILFWGALYIYEKLFTLTVLFWGASYISEKNKLFLTMFRLHFLKCPFSCLDVLW